MNSYLNSSVENRLQKSHAFWQVMIPYLGALESIKLQSLSRFFYRYAVARSQNKVILPCLRVYVTLNTNKSQVYRLNHGENEFKLVLRLNKINLSQQTSLQVGKDLFFFGRDPKNKGSLMLFKLQNATGWVEDMRMLELTQMPLDFSDRDFKPFYCSYNHKIYIP